MPFDMSLTDDQLKLRENASNACRAIVDQYSTLRTNERQKAAFNDVWQALVDMGFMGFLLPERYNGNNQGLLAATIVMEELAALSLHSFAPILCTMGAAAITRFGNESLKQEVLPQIANGKLKIAIAATEADAGFNVFNIRTAAEKQGDNYMINGSKIYVSGVDVTDYMLLVTRTIPLEECIDRGLSKTYGMSMFLVKTDADGLRSTPVPSHGEGVFSQFALTLNDVQVPSNYIVGKENEGAWIMFHIFNPERTLASAMALGMSRYCLELACEHARNRKVFGDNPIGAYQSIQHPLADIAIKLEAAWLMTYRSAMLFDNDAELSNIAESANAAKYLSAELAVNSVDAAIDVFGGKGFDEDHGIIHLWEAARLLKTAPISNALILNQIAEQQLRLPRSY
jgi:alkylation response protein AidB-like acyl-CoA dehydrogenase